MKHENITLIKYECNLITHSNRRMTKKTRKNFSELGVIIRKNRNNVTFIFVYTRSLSERNNLEKKKLKK